MAGIAIRPATLRDATDLAAFVDMAIEGIASHFWSEMAEAGQSPSEVGRARAMREEGAFSYRNAHIAEIGGAVAGALVGYLIDDPVDLSGIDQMGQFARDLTLLEAEAPGHWYVNVLATYPEYRGRGVGSALLAQADKLGLAASAKGMSIIVASENIGARRLYEKAGYREKASRPLVAFPGFKRGGAWVLLTKACA
jgi:ribosomal protein S18 acetylase RimI-like enzyme